MVGWIKGCDMLVERLPNESNFDYIKRLVYGKLVYKTIDSDFEELSESIFGEGNCYNSSEVRKRMYGIKHLIDLVEKDKLDGIQDDDILAEYENKKLEIQKEKYRLYDQRNAINKKLRDQARWDEIKDLVVKTIKESDLPKFEYKPNKIETSNNDLLCFLNDIHYGIEIDNHFNKYSPSIFVDRLKQYITKILEVKNLHKAENLHVFIGGDIISGHIHPQLQFANTENTIQQIQNVSERLCDFVNELHSEFGNVYIHLVPGNHSRIERNKKEAIKDERLDLLIPWYMKSRLQNVTNVHFMDNKIDNTISVLDIRGKLYYGVHGDYDSPKTAVSNLTLMLEQKPYAIIMAHLHHNAMNTVQDVKVLMSGSFIGMDDYCLEKRLIGKPSQLICVCNENGIDCSYDVILK